MTVKILTYTCDPKNDLVFALVDDGGEYLQIYTGNASVFNDGNNDPSALTWDTYTQQPYKLKQSFNSAFLISMRYANDAIYLKDNAHGKVIVVPNNLSQKPYNITILTDYDIETPEKSMGEFNAFHVFSDGSFYYGTTSGVYYINNKVTHAPEPTLSTVNLQSFPNTIVANEDIIVVSIENETRGVFVAKTREKDTPKQKWTNIGLTELGDIYDIFIDKTNFIVNLLTYSSNSQKQTLVLNRFSFKDYIAFGSNPEKLAAIDLGYNLGYTGFNSQLIATLPQDGNDLTIGFVETISADTQKTSKSRALILKSNTNGNYQITLAATNDIALTEGANVQSTIMAPSDSYAFYLHEDGTFYVAAGGIKKAFKPVTIEKINS